MDVAFVSNLKAQLEADPDRSRRGEKILKIINSPDSPRRTRRLKRMEAHARAAAGGGKDHKVIDWSKVDWAKVIDKIIEIILKFLPLIL